jgi:hypothetical protein
MPLPVSRVVNAAFVAMHNVALGTSRVPDAMQPCSRRCKASSGTLLRRAGTSLASIWTPDQQRTASRAAQRPGHENTGRHSRDNPCPSFDHSCPQREGAGKAGYFGVPAASCAKIESTRVRNYGHTGNTRHSPRNGFNGFLRALLGDRAFLPPSPRNAKHCRELMPASRHQDHTTSPSAEGAVRLSTPSRPSHPAQRS